MNFLMEMAFVGTAYHGFQVQKNAVAVCEVLQDAMEKVFGSRPPVKGCSRTDAGVHARRYCVSFKMETGVSAKKIPLALNQHLPYDIRINWARQVPEEFHARYSAIGKEYEYVFRNSGVDDPFRAGQYYRVYPHLDEGAMQEAVNVLLGNHDFASFMSAGSDIEDTVRTITSLRVIRQEDGVSIFVAADGFLYNMVRIIAGTLLLAGQHKLNALGMEEILAGKNRGLAGDTMPAKGLFLNKVFYLPESLELQK